MECKCVIRGDRRLGRVHIAKCPLCKAAPATLNMLQRITEKVKRANDIQHSGGEVQAEDWAELYMLQNEAFALLAAARGEG